LKIEAIRIFLQSCNKKLLAGGTILAFLQCFPQVFRWQAPFPVPVDPLHVFVKVLPDFEFHSADCCSPFLVDLLGADEFGQCRKPRFSSSALEIYFFATPRKNEALKKAAFTSSWAFRSIEKIFYPNPPIINKLRIDNENSRNLLQPNWKREIPRPNNCGRTRSRHRRSH